ncbi:DUF6266 family protein [Pedobacter sp. UYP1]|uniref:DUF6266 family protein n=1 Tax=Pedobacter sp. UYP1 TaxID=1756396 RepID=UPI00339B7905
MGKLTIGILGGFSGKVGTVIGARWLTLDVMKSLQKKNINPPVRSEIDQRTKFGLSTTLFDLFNVSDFKHIFFNF